MADTYGVQGVECVWLPGKGIKLHAMASGPPNGPLVFLLHGFPEFWYGWRRQIGPLAEAGFRVVAPDQRGYNLSDKPPGIRSYTLDLLADDVLTMACHLGCDRFAVVGHDWGAGVTWHLTARNPERVCRAAVLNGPNVATVWRYLLTHPSQALRSSYAGFFQLPLLPEWSLRAADFKLLRTALTLTSRPGTFFQDVETFHPYRDAWAQPGALAAMLNWYRALWHYVKPCERIRVPVMVVWGKHDKFINCDIAEAGLAQCDGRRELVYLDEATHWVQHEEPDRVNYLLTDFLRGLPPRQG